MPMKCTTMKCGKYIIQSSLLYKVDNCCGIEFVNVFYTLLTTWLFSMHHPESGRIVSQPWLGINTGVLEAGQQLRLQLNRIPWTGRVWCKMITVNYLCVWTSVISGLYGVTVNSVIYIVCFISVHFITVNFKNYSIWVFIGTIIYSGASSDVQLFYSIVWTQQSDDLCDHCNNIVKFNDECS